MRTSQLAIRAVRILAVPLLLVAAGIAPGTAVAARTVILGPRAAAISGILRSVVAVSARNAWAVGSTGLEQTLIMRWNGKVWKLSTWPSPSCGCPGRLASPPPCATTPASPAGHSERS